VTPTAKAVGMAGGTFYGNESLHPARRTVLCYPHQLSISSGLVDSGQRNRQGGSFTFIAKSKTAGFRAKSIEKS
jgi:hypothetical protein